MFDHKLIHGKWLCTWVWARILKEEFLSIMCINGVISYLFYWKFWHFRMSKIRIGCQKDRSLTKTLLYTQTRFQISWFKKLFQYHRICLEFAHLGKKMDLKAQVTMIKWEIEMVKLLIKNLTMELWQIKSRK